MGFFGVLPFVLESQAHGCNEWCRKLSGAFLLASRLGAEVNTKEIWDRVAGGYEFGL